MSATHQNPQMKNKPYQPLLIKPGYSAYSPTQKKQFFFLKISLPSLSYTVRLWNCSYKSAASNSKYVQEFEWDLMLEFLRVL